MLSRLGAAREQLFDRIEAARQCRFRGHRCDRGRPVLFLRSSTRAKTLPSCTFATPTEARSEFWSIRRRLRPPASTIRSTISTVAGRQRVAYGISEGGSEAAVIHVVDTATAQVLPDAIDRAYFIGVTSWLPDGKSFYYVRFPKLRPGEPEYRQRDARGRLSARAGPRSGSGYGGFRLRRRSEGVVRADGFPDRRLFAGVALYAGRDRPRRSRTN